MTGLYTGGLVAKGDAVEDDRMEPPETALSRQAASALIIRKNKNSIVGGGL